MRETSSHEHGIFSISVPFGDPLRRGLFSLVRKPLERSFHLSRLNSIYLQIVSEGHCARHFADRALEGLNIGYEVRGNGLASIPATGPLVVVANHPFGGVDGLVLVSLLKSVRQDAKIMANYLLSRIPELGDVLLSVDPFESKESSVRNIAPLRRAMDWLKEGHVLAIFPAGSVSSFSFQEHEVSDPRWHATVAWIVRKSKAPVLPIFFEGANSGFFHAAGLVHPALRTVLLPRELLKKRNRKIGLRVGRMLPYEKLDSFDTDERLVTYLRMRTYALREESSRPTNSSTIIERKEPVLFTPGIVPPIPLISALESEVDGLPGEQFLLRMGEYRVFYGSARQIPNILEEIGRLREVTFRETGEGTGRSSDLDRFDQYYTHLFVWNSETGHVVGAYRLGLVDQILGQYGKGGLYTSTLFDYKNRFLQHVEYGIELGRSFIRKEYQKLYAPLLLLWRGIAHFVARHPQYRTLFGPVSISRAYSDLSRQFMMAYMRINHYEPDLARFIKARTRMRCQGLKGLGLEYGDLVPADMEELSSLISELEPDRKGVPVLLKQYVKLGGKLMGFNVDPAFGHVLDGLIIVDLLKCNERVLHKYMGSEGAARFCCYHLNVLPEGLAS